MRKWKKLVGMAAVAAIFVCGCGAGETAATSAETAGMTAEDAASDSTSQEVSDKDTEQDTQGSSEAAGGDNVIRVGSILALGTATPFVAQENGLFEGSDISIEVTQFADGSALMEAFAAGELDVALSGVIPVATWISKGIDMKVVASANGGGHVLMTRKDTGITSVEDLKGKTIAEPNIATVTDALLRSKILGDAGLDPDMDVTLIPGMKPADMATVLMVTKEVDAMITWEPFAAQAEKDYEDITVLYDTAKEIKEETGSNAFYPVNVVAANQDFIDNRPEDLDKFLDIYKKTVDYINTDPGANAVLAKVLDMDETTIQNARERIDYTFDIDQAATLETLQWAADLGYIDKVPDESEIFYEKK
ncbi:ABC transporter substrate-binding protein [Robinsoniella peoriensis]|uniref:ABC transporter substrate-binding protein n=1 Tax=Robinsoniella peoriensis TaxID=180332 RepID=UPI00363388F7